MAEYLVKKSPVVIVKNFIILQAVAVVVYILISSLAHYAQIYRALPIPRAISFQIAQALFVFGAEVVIIFLIFFRWYKEYFQIEPGQIIYGRGILYRRKTIIVLEQISTISFHQGPLGKLVKYGTVELYENGTGTIYTFRDMPDPQNIVNLITRFKQAAAVVVRPPANEKDLGRLLQNGEDENLEFKSTLRWDLRTQKVNQNLEKGIMKTITAFLNAQGGQLVLGVDDQKIPLGLEADFATLGRPNADGFENHFSHIFHKMIGAEFRQFVHLHWTKLDDKECCIVMVAPAPRPAYLRTENGEEFYIRTGNGTTSLKFSEANAYIASRFYGKFT